MPARTFPNLGLQGDFDPGENGWDDEMTLNLLKLSVLTQGAVISKVAAEPGAPTAGDRHILDETHATHPNEVIVFDGPVGEEVWVYIVPDEGWLIYNQAANYYEKFDGAVWAELATGGGSGPTYSTVQEEIANYTVDPGDVGKYIRLTAVGTKNVTVDPEATTALPANGEWHFRNVGAGDATIVAGVGVTILPPNGGTLVVPQGGTVTLKRANADEFDLFGQVVAA